ncbi:MAG TPA: helix-turn-helix domain-containing protein [Ktedonobacterales bacterium]
MAPRTTPARRRARASELGSPRRLTFGGHTFQCYDQRYDKYSLVVMDDRIVHLSAATYALFVALLERAAQPAPDAIVAIDEMLAAALLGQDDAWARRALRKRLYMLRTKIEAFGLEVACVQERHAAVGYVLRLAS